MKWGKKPPGRWAPLQQPPLACACSCFQVPVRGGARHTETRRPRGKREHPTTAGSGLSSHTLHTHKQTSTIPETYRAHHTHTRAFCLRTSPSCLLTKSQLSPAICPCGQLWTKTERLLLTQESVHIWRISFLIFFWLMTLKYWKWWDCILCLKKPGCVSTSFPEASSSKDTWFYSSEG